MSNIRAIQYLGSKLNVKDDISKLVDKVSNFESTIVDGFAGTGVVGNELKSRYKIISNDSQKYSYLINKVILDKNLDETINRFSINKYLLKNKDYISNKEKLEKIFYLQLEMEEQVIKTEDLVMLANLTSSELYYDGSNFKQSQENKDQTFILDNYKNVLEYYSCKTIGKLRNSSNVNMLFCLYYINGYFSLRQCIEIDSIRFAISKMADEKLKDFSLFLLLHAVSEVTCSVGKQFAQPIKLIDKEGKIKKAAAKRCLRDWKLDIFDEIEDMYFRIKQESAQALYDNEIYNLDVNELLSQLSNYKNLVFYLDPPYTIDHYSRFYHVLEVLIEYDYPILEKKKLKGKVKILNGRYPINRFQSSLSIPSKAKNEFEHIFRKISKLNAKIILSYSEANKEGRGRVVSKSELLELLNNNFESIEVYEIDHDYRKLNKEELNTSSDSTRELVFVGENRG